MGKGNRFYVFAGVRVCIQDFDIVESLQNRDRGREMGVAVVRSMIGVLIVWASWCATVSLFVSI